MPVCLKDGSLFFFFSSRRRHTRSDRDWSSDVCSSDLRRPHERASCRRRPRGSDGRCPCGRRPRRTLRAREGRKGRACSRALRSVRRSEEHTSELQSRSDLVCRLLLEKKKKKRNKDQAYKKNNRKIQQARNRKNRKLRTINSQ